MEDAALCPPSLRQSIGVVISSLVKESTCGFDERGYLNLKRKCAASV